MLWARAEGPFKTHPGAGMEWPHDPWANSLQEGLFNVRARFARQSAFVLSGPRLSQG